MQGTQNIVGGNSYSFNDAYQRKLLQQSQTAATLGALITRNQFPQIATISNASAIYVNAVLPTNSCLEAVKPFFPILTDDLGFRAVYSSLDDKPVELDYISYFDKDQGTTIRDWKMQLNVSNLNLNNKSRITNVLDPEDDGDVATKRFVAKNIGNLWWTKPALGNMDMCGNVIENVKLRLNEKCPSDPYLTPDSDLVLEGNGCSSGKWFYRMTKDIRTLEISGIADLGEFTLVLKGSPERTLFIEFLGNDRHQCFTSWAGRTAVGKSSFVTLRIIAFDSHYLVHMIGYN